MPPPRAKSKSSSTQGKEAAPPTKDERNRERERSRGGKNRSSSRGKTREKESSKSNRNTNGTKQPESSQRPQPHRSTGEASKRYVYSAISATFFFLLFRELGWMQGNNDTGTSPTTATATFNLKGTNNKISNLDKDSFKSSKARTIALAGTSSAGGMQNKFDLKTQSPKQHMTRKELMAAMTELDGNFAHDDNVTSRLPIIFTFFEWIPPRNRGTQMSDQADLGLMAEWKLAWRKAGWNPKVLTLDDAKRHASYETYAPELNKIQMLGVDGMGGNVVYNQLCFLRWLAVAAAGGGYMADYDVFPISLAPTAQDPPFGGNFTVYSKIKNSQGAGIPCLMSGSESEWTRMAYAILENGLKHAKTENMWSDMLAIIDMRADRAYQLRDIVAEGQDVLLKHGWSESDCKATQTKKAIHFSHEALRKGYIRPGETAEDRPYIIRRFLQKWHNVCTETRLEEAAMPEQEEVAADLIIPKQTWTKKRMPGVNATR